MRNASHHSPDRDRANDDILVAIIEGVAPQPPRYQIQQVTEHTWGLWKWNTFEQCYVFLNPRCQSCITEAEAIAWMMADAEQRAPDFSLFEPVIWDAPTRQYDAAGRLVPSPPAPRKPE